MSRIRNLVLGMSLAGLVFSNNITLATSAGKTPILAIDTTSLGDRDIFNIRFKEINIQNCKIWDILLLLAETIEKGSGGKRHFEVGLESSRTEGYLNRGVPASQWNLGGPRVSLVGSNMTLETIINVLCSEAGWSYDDRTPVGIIFTDSKKFPKPKR